MPVEDNVAAIWNELTDVPADQPHDICVYSSSGKTHQVHYYYGCYDPLQYPLLFPYGEPGWHTGIERLVVPHEQKSQCRRLLCRGQSSVLPQQYASGEVFLADELDNLTMNRWRLTNVAVREFYCYLFQMRPTDTTNILRTGRLAQQYPIDCYVKMETQRFDFLGKEQQNEQLHVKSYYGITDFLGKEQQNEQLHVKSYYGITEGMSCEGETPASRVGKKFVLPATFVSSPRDMRRRYLNALALVVEYGKPDFFIMMTCNPNWPEIRDNLLPGEEAQARSDLVAWVFREMNE